MGRENAELQERLFAIVASVTDAIVAVESDARIAFFNPAAEKLFHCSADEAVGASIDLFIPGCCRAAPVTQIEELDGAGEADPSLGVRQRSMTARRADGTEFPVEVSLSHVTLDGQRLSTAVVRDPADRRNAEVALRESEARRRAIVETAVDGIITIDGAGLVTSFNPAATRIFGYAPEEVLGKNIKLLMPEPYRREHDGYLRNYHQTGEKKIIGIGREVIGLRKDGTQFPMDLAVSETQLGDRQVFTGIVRDISDRKRAEEAMATQAEHLARSNVELERFAYVASHDLQEPMRTVRSFAQLLQRRCGDQLSGDAVDYLQFISSGVERMQTLINDLLAYSRVSSQGAAFAAADCNQIVQRVLESLYATIESQSARISVDPLPVVLGDATQLGQLFQNLLGNAIKFHGEQRPRIKIGAARQPTEWVFSIADNGIGIAPEYFDRIFIIFQRLHTIEEYGGTGIGLAICKKIVERHGGRIWLTSNVGKGTTFYFSIPRRERAE